MRRRAGFQSPLPVGAAALSVAALAGSAAAGGPLHVDDDAPPGGDGLSWAAPLRNLQDALDASVPGTTILVAGGRYTPDLGAGREAGDRTETFRIPSGIAVRGGYAGFAAPDPGARDPLLHPTVLSGDLLGDDGPGFALIGDNSLHVVTVSNTSSSTLLEDLEISGGNADGPGSLGQMGAGVLGFGASATFVRCTITGNLAAFQGAGVQLKSGSAATFIECAFSQNRALDNGGAFYNGESTPTLDRCTFTGNSGRLYAGAICNRDGSDALIVQCTFIGNTAAEEDPLTGGGAIVNASSSPHIIACSFIDNTAIVGRGGAVYNKFGDNPFPEPSAPVIEQCTFQGNGALLGGAVYADDESLPLLRLNFFAGNTALTGGGGAIWVTGGALAVEQCVFTENIAEAGGAIWCDRGLPTISGSTFTGNEAGNGGAVFNRETPCLLTDCTFIANHADTNLGGGAIWNEVSDVIVQDCAFRENSGDSGGAVYNLFDSDAIYTNCTFERNVAVSPIFPVGGAMGTYESSPLILGCTFVGNVAPLGGGALYNENIATGRAHYVNCLVVANVAGSLGGGAYNFFSRPRYTNCTFADNRLTDRGATGGAVMTHVDAPAVIVGCILWGNDAQQIDGEPAEVRFSCVQGGHPGPGNIDVDPLFVQAADPGPDGVWATADDDPGDQHLQEGSPCIDAGDRCALPADAADLDGDGDRAERTPLDHGGNPRFVNGPGTAGLACPALDTVDMGALEYQGGDIIAPMRVGDVDGDGSVDALDLQAVILGWGPCTDECCPADVDRSGAVDARDWLAVLADW